MLENLSYKFVERLFNLSKAEFSNSVIHQAKKCLLDYLAVTYAGAKILHRKCFKYLEINDSIPFSTIIGFNTKTSIHDAILWNGMNSHVAELDDGVRYGVLHPGSPILSALLPVAEKEGVSNMDLLKGIILGYEAAICLASSIQPSHYEKGFHPTSTCGTIGAALGIASMLNFSKQEMMDTLAAASLSAYGTLKVIENGSALKPYNSGRAALNGFISATLARISMNGDSDPLAGPHGFLNMMSSSFDVEKIMGDKDIMAIEKIYFKPYASCRHTHAPIEAALNLQRQNSIKIENIKHVTIKTYKGVIGKHDHKNVTNAASAKMSIPFSVAIALKTGQAGLSEFNDANVNHNDIISLNDKITVIADEEISSLVPHKRAAQVSIEMRNKQLFEYRIDLPKGEPENPISDKELKDKFIQLTSYAGMDRGKIDSISSHIMNFENEKRFLFEVI